MGSQPNKLETAETRIRDYHCFNFIVIAKVIVFDRKLDLVIDPGMGNSILIPHTPCGKLNILHRGSVNCREAYLTLLNKIFIPSSINLI